MESLILHFIEQPRNHIISCFNPCFNGISYLTRVALGLKEKGFQGFNPCFNGISYLTHVSEFHPQAYKFVSILVLMESLILLLPEISFFSPLEVSILVLMESLILLIHHGAAG